jgi:MoaD family protein
MKEEEMEVRVRVPAPLKKLAEERDVIKAQGKTVEEVLRWLTETYPGLKKMICDEQGRVRRFINIYVNDEDIRFIQNLETPLKEGDQISIVPAIAGGSPLKREGALIFAPKFMTGAFKTVKAFKDWLIIKAKKEGSEISVEETHQLLQKKEPIVLLDIREKEEIAVGYIEGATFLPQGLLSEKVENLLPDKDVPVVIYCTGGIRSLAAAKLMKEKGYTHVFSMAKGINEWKAAGCEVVSDSELTPDQLTRYSRHLMLKEVGMEGQIQLLKAKVLLVGAGGLGCPAALYLAAAGVGTLGIVDSDKVDLTNLQRQVLHGLADVGRPKTESAKEAIRRINPGVKVVTYQERLTPQNALEIFQKYDLIIDGSDNFPTKYLVNDASFLTGKPYIYGGVFQFEGQASVFFPKEGGPCLRCLFPEPPPPGLVPS